MKRLAEEAMETLRMRIEAGEWEAGGLLPSQRELCEQLGIGRSSLREALSVLEAMGMVRPHAGKGVFVTALTPQSRFEVRDPRNGRLLRPADIYQLRYVLEPFAAALAADQALPAQIEHLRRLQRQFEYELRSEALDAAADTDAAFHGLIVEATGNLALVSLIEQAGGAMLRAHELMQAETVQRLAPLEEHAAILDAIAARDHIAARVAMQDHIVNAAARKGIAFVVPDIYARLGTARQL